MACRDCRAHKGKDIDVTKKQSNVTAFVVRRMMNREGGRLRRGHWPSWSGVTATAPQHVPDTCVGHCLATFHTLETPTFAQCTLTGHSVEGYNFFIYPSIPTHCTLVSIKHTLVWKASHFIFAWIRGGQRTFWSVVPPEECLISAHQVHWPSSDSSTQARRKQDIANAHSEFFLPTLPLSHQALCPLWALVL